LFPVSILCPIDTISPMNGVCTLPPANCNQGACKYYWLHRSHSPYTKPQTCRLTIPSCLYNEIYDDLCKLFVASLYFLWSCKCMLHKVQLQTVLADDECMRVSGFFFFFFWIWITPEGFTTVVANEGLEKARAYLNQVPRDRRLYIPFEGCGINFRWKHLQTTPTHFLGRAE